MRARSRGAHARAQKVLRACAAEMHFQDLKVNECFCCIWNQPDTPMRTSAQTPNLNNCRIYNQKCRRGKRGKPYAFHVSRGLRVSSINTNPAGNTWIFGRVVRSSRLLGPGRLCHLDLEIDGYDDILIPFQKPHKPDQVFKSTSASYESTYIHIDSFL